MGGWVDGWMDGWSKSRFNEKSRAVLRIAYSNQK
jgi:hypothetical protein